MSLEFFINQNCLNKEWKCDLSYKLCILWKISLKNLGNALETTYCFAKSKSAGISYLWIFRRDLFFSSGFKPNVLEK